jgi:hypothetical protein
MPVWTAIILSIFTSITYMVCRLPDYDAVFDQNEDDEDEDEDDLLP